MPRAISSFPVPVSHKSAPSNPSAQQFHVFENSAQRSAIPYDLGKIHFRTDFIFQIEFFLRELLFQFTNLAVASAFSTARAICFATWARKLISA